MKKDNSERVQERKSLADDLEITEEERILQEIEHQDTRRELEDFIQIIHIN